MPLPCEARAERAEADTEDDACQHLGRDDERARRREYERRADRAVSELARHRHDSDHGCEGRGEGAVPDQLSLVLDRREIGLTAEAAGDHAEQDQRNQAE